MSVSFFDKNYKECYSIWEKVETPIKTAATITTQTIYWKLKYHNVASLNMLLNVTCIYASSSNSGLLPSPSVPLFPKLYFWKSCTTHQTSSEQLSSFSKVGFLTNLRYPCSSTTSRGTLSPTQWQKFMRMLINIFHAWN